MKRSSHFMAITAALAAVASVSCAKSDTADAGSKAPLVMAKGTGVQPVENGQTALSPAAIGNVGREFTPADVEFMSGMISHHAQAVVMAGWAPTHGARSDVKLLCERIVVGQTDEIGLMQRWLQQHNQTVPDAHDTKMHMKMNGADQTMMMPGMLTDAQMAALDKARGAEFDRLFLTGMIQHHQGAITMVNKLFASNGAAQDEVVFKFANDVFADQTTEITRMNGMLASVK
jgi:uncharacterized protein (DUF305 family)